MRWILAVLAAVLIAGCGGSAPLTVHGTLQVSDFSDSGTGCDLGSTGYSDITPGAQVVITSPQGTVLGSGALGDPVSEVGSVICTFPFTVTGVQGGEARYGVTVSHRGTVWFSPQRIQHAGLQLGS
jgi:hypothetical protein